MLYFFVCFTALAITMVLIPLLMRVPARLAMLDYPGERKTHARAVPRIGGVAMAIGALVPVLLWVPLSRELTSLLLALAVILAFGVWDDLKDLDYRLKFLGQLIAVAIVVFFGGVVVERNPLDNLEVWPDTIAIPFTIFALLGITNAINLADGLDGLAGGTTLLSFGCIALLAHLAGGTTLVLIALAMAGAILGFLRYNTYPARVFMGDSGSQLLGFAAGVLVILLTQRVHTALSPVVAILLLGFPILDTFTVMVQRLYEGRSPFVSDNNHIHHKFLKLGLDHYEAVFLIYIAHAGLVISAYVFRYYADIDLLLLYAGFCAATMIFFRMAERRHWRLGGAGDRVSFFARQVERLRANHWLSKGPCLILKVTVSALFVLAAVMIDRVPADIGMTAAVMGIVLLFVLLARRVPFNFVERLVVYVTGAFIVYLLQTQTGPLAAHMGPVNLFFVLLALVVVIGIRFNWGHDFRVTPLDFLVIFIALVVPNLPDFRVFGAQLAVGVPKVIVLFYAVEFVLRSSPRYWDLLRYATLGSLTVLGVRGLFL